MNPNIGRFLGLRVSGLGFREGCRVLGFKASGLWVFRAQVFESSSFFRLQVLGLGALEGPGFRE